MGKRRHDDAHYPQPHRAGRRIPLPCTHSLLLNDGRCASCGHQTRNMEPDAHEEALARHYGDTERSR